MGGYILGGSSSSNKGADKTEYSKGGHDYWLVKLDAKGKKVWDRTIGGNYSEGISTLEQTRDGGYILGGSTASGKGGDKSEENKTSPDEEIPNRYDYWLVKLDANGNKVWDKTYGGNSTDFLSSVQQTQDGGYILGGSSDSRISGDKTQDSKSGCKPGYGDYGAEINCPNDYWIIKVDAKGQKQWDKTFGGLEDDNLKSIRQTPDGGYILAGSSNSGKNADKSQVAYGKQDACTSEDEAGNRYCGYHYDFWVIKIDILGNKIWDTTIGGDNDDELAALDLTPDGNYILGGTSSSNKSGNKSANNKGYQDYWLVKLTAEGRVSWDNTFGGNWVEALHSLQATNDGGYILGGNSSSDSGQDKSENSKGTYQNQDYWVVKVNATGNKVWDKTIGGDDIDELNSIRQTQEGGYLLAGSSISNKGADKSEARRGEEGVYDGWIVKLTENNKQGQTITYTPIPDRTTTAGPFTLTATVSSGLPLVYELVSGPGKLQGALVRPTGSGIIVIKVNQPGNASYLPAQEVILKINIIIYFYDPVIIIAPARFAFIPTCTGFGKTS